MEKLIADRPLTGDYGQVRTGDTFEAPFAVAKSLIERGLAHKARPPRVVYETKPAVIETQQPKVETKPVITEKPQPVFEVKPEELQNIETRTFDAPEVARPFRDVPLHHQEPPEVAPAGDPGLPGANIPEAGVADRRRRRKRQRPPTASGPLDSTNRDR